MKKDDLTLTKEQKIALQELHVVLCYLHGSVASGVARPESDADIAVLFETAPKDPLQATTMILEALHGLFPARSLDIAILNEASPLLKQIVASTGELLYARSPDDALRFELRAMHDYEHSKYVVRLGQDLALKRVGL